METAYVLVQCKIAHEMEVLKALLEIDLVKEAKGTFGYYDIFTKIHGNSWTRFWEMSKKTRSIDKKGFSNKFFEELDKEHDNAKEFAKRQNELKEKKKKQS